MTAPQLSMKDLRRVVIAAAVGNVIEWYDFYIFGSLATLLATKFFAAGASGSALIKYVGTFNGRVLDPPIWRHSCSVVSATSWAASTRS